MKRTWNLDPVLWIVQKIIKNYCPCLYLSIDQVWWFHGLWFKRYSKMYLVSCTNTHCDVTDLVNHEMVKNTRTWISWEWNIIFLWNKKILNLCLRWHILRSYRFVAEVTFNELQKEISGKKIETSLTFNLLFVNIIFDVFNNILHSCVSSTFNYLVILW